MKTTKKVLALVALLTASSQGATTISGSLALSGFRDQLAANVPTGSLVMLVADMGGGFLDLSKSKANPDDPAAPVTGSLNGQTGRTITTSQAGTMAGSNLVSGLIAGNLFGGDTIVCTTLTGSSGSISGILPGIDITNYINKNFAVVWFAKTPAELSAVNGLANQYFGMIRLADWILPSADSGATYSLSSSDASGANSYFSTSTTTTATQLGTGFFTGTGTAANTGSTASRQTLFQIVPEPSAALLGALGALGLLRRRRI